MDVDNGMQHSDMASSDVVSTTSSHEGSEASLMTCAPSDRRRTCAVCGDVASGKHYGVYRLEVCGVMSCEGCKGFFKRTVRKELVYECHQQGNCEIDKSKRNRCQFCRYNMCLVLGMRREAVQDERQKVSTYEPMMSDQQPQQLPVTSTFSGGGGGSRCVPADLILEAELAAEAADAEMADFADLSNDDDAVICDAIDKHLLMLVEWARHLPEFLFLPFSDQINLLRSGWNELLIASLAHWSTATSDCIVLARGLYVYRSNAHQLGFGLIFDRILAELVYKMRELEVDRTELGCLRAIVLFNPDVQGLRWRDHIEALREEVYKSLDDYCQQMHPDDPDRFSKLMLRLPSLRSIGLKCTTPLFSSRLIGNMPIESFLHDLLQHPQ